MFKNFSEKVLRHFEMMSKNQLFKVNSSGDELLDLKISHLQSLNKNLLTID